MIRRFDRIEGRYIEKIYGQERLAYSRTDNTDFCDLSLWDGRGGYQGDVLTFHDFTNGKVYQPFEKKPDTVYGEPVYAGGSYYFLQGDYKNARITLYRFIPEEVLEPVKVFGWDEVSPYNLRIIGDPLYVISQNGEEFACYYPNKASFRLEPHQTVTLIDDGKVYLEEWVEEGWDDEKDCASQNYQYYHKVIVKDWDGNTLSEEVGFLFASPDGSYWIA